MKCSACGQRGHMKTNRACPRYSETAAAQRNDLTDDDDMLSAPSPPPAEPHVMATENPLRLKINAKAVKAAAASAQEPAVGTRNRARRAAGIDLASLSEQLLRAIEVIKERTKVDACCCCCWCWCWCCCCCYSFCVVEICYCVCYCVCMCAWSFF